MDGETRTQVMEMLRRASRVLEADEAEVIMPGWDEQCLGHRERGIRIAALAIAAEGKSPDDGTRVHLQDLGFLVRYVADMLEL